MDYVNSTTGKGDAFMVKREMYISRIRPFIGKLKDVVKRNKVRDVDMVKDNFPKYVVTMDELDRSRNGIKHRNIRDFLTASEWN